MTALSIDILLHNLLNIIFNFQKGGWLYNTENDIQSIKINNYCSFQKFIFIIIVLICLTSAKSASSKEAGGSFSIRLISLSCLCRNLQEKGIEFENNELNISNGTMIHLF